MSGRGAVALGIGHVAALVWKALCISCWSMVIPSVLVGQDKGLSTCQISRPAATRYPFHYAEFSWKRGPTTIQSRDGASSKNDEKVVEERTPA